MVVIVEQLPLDLYYLGVEILVGVGPGSVEVLAHQVTPEQKGQSGGNGRMCVVRVCSLQFRID